MKKDGKAVELDKLNFSNLNVRFGDKCSLKDFNVTMCIRDRNRQNFM